MEQKHIDIVKSYASTLTYQLNSEGLWIEREDLEQEFFVCYAKSKLLYDAGNTIAKFETYFISAILNRLKDIRSKMMTEARGTSQRFDSSGADREADSEKFEAVLNSVRSRLTAKEQRIMSELMSPSDEVREMVGALSVGRRNSTQLYKSIATVQGVNYNELRHRINKIRARVQKSIGKSNSVLTNK